MESDEMLFRRMCETFGLTTEMFDRRNRVQPIEADKGNVPTVYRVTPDYNRIQELRMEFNFSPEGKFVSAGCW